MIAGIADTHTIIWYLDRDLRLSAPARNAIEITAQDGDVIGVSTITLVETIYLIEKQKVPVETLPRMVAALRTPKGVFVEVPLDLDIAEALRRVDRSLVPDMPDRIVAATALHLKVPVISRDGKIACPESQRFGKGQSRNRPYPPAAFPNLGASLSHA